MIEPCTRSTLLAPVSPISWDNIALRGVQAPTRAGRDGKRLNSTVYGYTFLLATLISSQLTEFRAEQDTRLTRIEAEIKTQGARIDDLLQVIWRVIWPLTVLLAGTVFGLLYKAVIG